MGAFDQLITIFIILFILGFWIGVFLLLYHLIRFGIGTHPRRIAFFMIIVSLLLTILSVMLLFTIK